MPDVRVEFTDDDEDWSCVDAETILVSGDVLVVTMDGGRGTANFPLFRVRLWRET